MSAGKGGSLGFVFDVPSDDQKVETKVPVSEPKPEVQAAKEPVKEPQATAKAPEEPSKVLDASRDSMDASEAVAAGANDAELKASSAQQAKSEAVDEAPKDDKPSPAEQDKAQLSEQKTEAKAVEETQKKSSTQSVSKDEKQDAKGEADRQVDEAKEVDPAAKPANKDKSEQPRGEAKGKSLKAKKGAQAQTRDSKSESKGLQDDEVHDEFFRKGEEVDKEHIAAHSKSLPPSPVEFHFDDDQEVRPRQLTPELINRQKRLRRIVTYVLGASIVLAVGAIIKFMSGADHASIDEKNAMAALPTITKTEPAVVKTAAVEKPSAVAPTAASVEAPVASVEAPAASVSAAASASAAPAASSSIPDGVDPKKEALRLLERSKFKEAIPFAEAAIERDPADAYGYLYLGTALQSTGKWKEGIAAYCRCVHNATKGPVVECRQSGGH
jgi:hypothetical protein